MPFVTQRLRSIVLLEACHAKRVARNASDDSSVLALAAVGKKLVEDLSAQEVVTPGSPWFVGSRMAGSPWFAAVAVDPIVFVHPDVKFSL